VRCEWTAQQLVTAKFAAANFTFELSIVVIDDSSDDNDFMTLFYKINQL